MAKLPQIVETREQKPEAVVIPRPKMKTAAFDIAGTAPLVMCRFSAKAAEQMIAQQQSGEQKRKGGKREPRNFEQMYQDAQHFSTEGWVGIPAAAFRKGMISACRVVGFKMTQAKLCVFVEADGFDKVDGTALVRLTRGKAEKHMMPGRNADGGVDIRCRAMFREWAATVRVTYDADQFSLTDVASLLMRVGLQVGVGEGRHDSRNSAGMGWGTFQLTNEGKAL